MTKTILLHLVSHASGELIEMLARNSVAQLEGITVERKLWKMVRSMAQVPDILAAIGAEPGVVMHSIAASDVREALEEGCRRMHTPCLFALEPFVSHLSAHFEAPVRYRTSARDLIDEDYYQRVEAMKYTLAHDDGIRTDDLDDAEVVLVGVSRTTKTPTCMYLASRGFKAANVPLVPEVPLPDSLLRATRPLIVGLTMSPTLLATVRAARLRLLKEDRASDYADTDALKEEVRMARRLYHRQGWPIIDVTHRSIEQTSSLIVEMMKRRDKIPG